MLGFHTSQDAFTEVPGDNFMQYELDNFWGSITMETPSDYERMNSTIIHNPTIRYFHMVLTQTFFEKSEATNTISKEELFIVFSVF